MNADRVLSVLVPAYNEERTIEHVLRRVLKLDSLLHEIIVVDDGSQDGTVRIVTDLAAEEPRIRLFEMDRNRGKTAAVRRGLEEVGGEIVIIQDADLEYDPVEIPDVVRPILQDHADVVYGSRFLVRRAARVLYFHHYLANKLLTLLSNILTNRNWSDVETCYKAFRSCVICPLKLKSSGFGMEVEITALVSKTKARTYEVPISYYGRTYEEGKKIGFSDALAAVYYILRDNLVTPWRARGRTYRRTVNAALEPIHARLPAEASAAWPTERD